MNLARLARACARKASRSVYGQNARLERRFAREEWMRELLACQAEVAQTAPDHYRDRYMAMEKCWWARIPEWIWGGRGGAKSVADFGAGYGTLSLFCRRAHPRASISCFDIAPGNMAPGLEKEGITCERADVGTAGAGQYDIVLFTEVLEHLDFHPSVALSRLRDSLSPGGVMYLSTPDAGQWGRVTRYYRSVDDMPRSAGDRRADDHIYQYGAGELERLVKGAGLEVARRGYSPGVVSRHFNLELRRA